MKCHLLSSNKTELWYSCLIKDDTYTYVYVSVTYVSSCSIFVTNGTLITLVLFFATIRHLLIIIKISSLRPQPKTMIPYMVSTTYKWHILLQRCTLTTLTEYLQATVRTDLTLTDDSVSLTVFVNTCSSVFSYFHCSKYRSLLHSQR